MRILSHKQLRLAGAMAFLAAGLMLSPLSAMAGDQGGSREKTPDSSAYTNYSSTPDRAWRRPATPATWAPVWPARRTRRPLPCRRRRAATAASREARRVAFLPLPASGDEGAVASSTLTGSLTGCPWGVDS